jgi:hypothetical protein
MLDPRGAVQTRSSPRRLVRRKGRRKRRTWQCSCCNATVPFCWSCRCGLEICQSCMEENRWGLTCNNITWQCPDCGDWNNFGNQ